jgi:hypothetical protein
VCARWRPCRVRCSRTDASAAPGAQCGSLWRGVPCRGHVSAAKEAAATGAGRPYVQRRGLLPYTADVWFAGMHEQVPLLAAVPKGRRSVQGVHAHAAVTQLPKQRYSPAKRYVVQGAWPVEAVHDAQAPPQRLEVGALMRPAGCGRADGHQSACSWRHTPSSARP